MARLRIRLLGGIDVVLDGQPVTDFESASTQALLALLASEPGQRWRRSALAELLWPDRPSGKALANLRHSLAVLRQLIDDDSMTSILLRTGDAVAIDPTADVWIDVADFRRLARTSSDAAGAVAAWESAAALRRGSFLAGFDPGFSEEWESWLLRSRATVDTLTIDVLDRLAELRERSGERDRADELTRRELEIDPWNEVAHGRLIRLLALDGRPADAVAHGEAFMERLDAQLGVDPADELVAVLDDVRCGRIVDRAQVVPGLATPRVSPGSPFEPCVARDEELAWLHGCLDDALGGTGRLVFVSGSAGAGKSVLLRAFASAVRDRMPEVCVLRGSCNGFTGPGDPYLPFRQVLGLLSGDLEQAWRHGDLTRSEAERLWAGVPDAAEAVLDRGQYLLGGLVDATALLRRLERGYPQHPVTTRLESAVAATALQAPDPQVRDKPIREQCVDVIARLAEKHPMLLIVDDLHWSDSGTMDVLRHLSTRISELPVVVVGAFRPHDQGPDSSERDRVGALVHEVQAHSSSESVVELAGSREFVDAWLDMEPNLFDVAFRTGLFTATHGHALFTVEMIGALREHGDIFLDDRGRWTTSGSIGWDRLPPRVEATIATRMTQLLPESRRDLEIASVQGITFDAETVAAVRGVDDSDVSRRLAALTESAHALVEYAGVERAGTTRLHRYRFRHGLIRQYLYDGMAEPDRIDVHEAIAHSIGESYGEQLDDVVVELAHHAERAGLAGDAIDYHGRAGQRAMKLSAISEAIEHFRRALELLGGEEPSAERDRLEVALLTPLGGCLQARHGYTASATHDVYERLRGLLDDAEPTLESAGALGSLIAVDGLRARYGEAIAGSERLLAMAAELGAPPVEAVARTHLGWLLFMTCELSQAEEQLDRAIDMYETDWNQWLTYVVGFHVSSTARAWRAMLAWHLGRSDQAQRDAAMSIEEARATGYPFGVAFALAVAGCGMSELLGDGDATVEYANELATIADREGFAFYSAGATVHRGYGAALQGRLGAGARDMGRGLASWSEIGTEAFIAWLTCFYVQFLIEDGQLDVAERVLFDVEYRVAAGEERLAQCWLPLAQAAMACAQGDDNAAEVVLRESLAMLRSVDACGPELRTATALAELLCDHGRYDDARALLQPMLDDVDEGCDTVDAQLARAVIDRTTI